MIIEFSSQCIKELAQLKKKNSLAFKKFQKQLNLFQQTQTHRSLRLHKLKGSMADTWSISIDMSLRALFYYRQVGTEKRAVFFTIGTHKEVYK
jgi:addiction module RelE/StbE family toxin